MRARYAYDPYGRRTRLTGDVEADFGFAGMFWASATGLYLTRFRFYDADFGPVGCPVTPYERRRFPRGRIFMLTWATTL